MLVAREPPIAPSRPGRLEMYCYTIGHANHRWNLFVGLLKKNGIHLLLDIRPEPDRSPRRFHANHLSWLLPTHGIRYRWEGEALGGRPADSSLPVAGGSDRRAVMHADLRYREGLLGLLQELRNSPDPVCLLGGSEDPAACHRHWLIGNDLLSMGVEVLHIRKPRNKPDRVLKFVPPARARGTRLPDSRGSGAALINHVD